VTAINKRLSHIDIHGVVDIRAVAVFPAHGQRRSSTQAKVPQLFRRRMSGEQRPWPHQRLLGVP